MSFNSEDKIFAVFEFQGRQHKVTKDDLVMLDKSSLLKVGDTVFFEKILLIGSASSTAVGRPYISSAKVVGTVEEQSSTEKVIVFKKRRRKGYQKNMGHREEIVMVRIDKIIYSADKELEVNKLT